MVKTRSKHRYHKYVKTLGGALVKGYRMFRKGQAVKQYHDKLVKLRNRGRALRTSNRYKLNRQRYVGHETEKTAEQRNFKCVITKRKRLFKSLGTWTYYQQQFGSITNVEGQQAGALITCHWSADQFYANPGTAANIIQFANNIYDMNPFQAVTNVSTYAAAPAQPLDDSVHCKKVVGDLQIVNLSTLATQVVLYWFIAKVSYTDNAYTEWQNCLASEALGQSAAAQPITWVAAPGLGYPTQTTYGTTPMTSSSFRKEFKVLKKVDFMLAGGATEKIAYDIELNKTFPRRLMRELAGNGVHFKNGASVEVVAVIRPTPVMVQDGGADAGVTIGTAKIGYTLSSKYTFTSLGGSRLSVNRVLASYVDDTVGTEKIISAVDSTITNVAI